VTEALVNKINYVNAEQNLTNRQKLSNIVELTRSGSRLLKQLRTSQSAVAPPNTQLIRLHNQLATLTKYSRY